MCSARNNTNRNGTPSAEETIYTEPEARWTTSKVMPPEGHATAVKERNQTNDEKHNFEKHNFHQEQSCQPQDKDLLHIPRQKYKKKRYKTSAQSLQVTIKTNLLAELKNQAPNEISAKRFVFMVTCNESNAQSHHKTRETPRES